MSTTEITNVRIFDGNKLTDPRTVVIENGFISHKSTASETIDGQGKTLIPGLIDAHVHLSSKQGTKVLEDAAFWGVTTVLDMATVSPELVESQRNLEGMADIRSSYHPASAAGGPSVLNMGFPKSSIVSKPEDGKDFVQQQIKLGADYIKLILEDPNINPDAALTNESAKAIVDAAHQYNLKTFAHVPNVASFEIGIYAGVDVLTHTPLDRALPKTLVQEMAKRKIISVPTVLMMKGIIGQFKAKVPMMNNQTVDETLHSFIKAGVPIVAGTDANDNESAPYQLQHGPSLHQELEEYVNAGMTPVQALQSATCNAAYLLGFKDRGVIEPGRRADLLLVDGDPTVDIKATQAIHSVWIKGKKIR